MWMGWGKSLNPNCYRVIRTYYRVSQKSFLVELLTAVLINNTIKAGGSTARAQSKMSEWVSGVVGYPLDCYDYYYSYYYY